jgi:hypothetical protein
MHSCSVVGYWSLWICLLIAYSSWGVFSQIGWTESCQTCLVSWNATEIYISKAIDGDIYGRYWISIHIEIPQTCPLKTDLGEVQSHILLKQSLTPKTPCIMYRAGNVWQQRIPHSIPEKSPWFWSPNIHCMTWSSGSFSIHSCLFLQSLRLRTELLIRAMAE